MINSYRYNTKEEQAEALTTAVANAIKLKIQEKKKKIVNIGNNYNYNDVRVVLALSGGKSPRLFFEKLSFQKLEWDLVDVTLVDERWIPHNHLESNYRFIKEFLIKNYARDAKLYPLYKENCCITEQVKNINNYLRLPDIAILGMGDDGHTASLFSDAPEWKSIITVNDLFVTVSPQLSTFCRISLSLKSLIKIEHLFLQFTGQNKAQVFHEAENKISNNAMSLLISRRKKQLNVYSC